MNQEYIIEKCQEPVEEITSVDEIIAEVEGKPKPEKKPLYYYRYRNQEDSPEFRFILGAFALGFEYPNFAIVIGLDRHEDPEHGACLIRCLEEFEAFSLEELIEGCLKLKKKYGAFPILHRGWYCDLDPTASGRFYRAMEQMGHKFSKCPRISGPFFMSPNPSLDCLYTLLAYKGVLKRGNCDKLRRWMEKGPQNRQEASRLKPEDNPALMAVALAVSTMMIQKPWTWELRAGRYIRFDD